MRYRAVTVAIVVVIVAIIIGSVYIFKPAEVTPSPTTTTTSQTTSTASATSSSTTTTTTTTSATSSSTTPTTTTTTTPIEKTIITVGEGKDYATILEAINHASSGCRIEVYSGNYIGNIQVTLSNLTIVAVEGPDVTTIQGVVYLNVGNLTFENFKVTGEMGINGIEVMPTPWAAEEGIGVSGCVVRNNIVTGYTSGDGILLRNASYCTVENNNSSGNNIGLLIENNSTNNTIEGNTCSNNIWNGVWVRDSGTGYNTIRNNTMISNGECGIKLSVKTSNNTVESNHIDNSGAGLADKGWAVFLDGDVFDGCDNNTIIGNVCLNSGDRAIWVRKGSDGNRIENNTISGAGYSGIDIETSENNVVTKNDITGVTGPSAGISLGTAHYTTIENNYVHGNTIGVKILIEWPMTESNKIGIHVNHNNIEGNTQWGFKNDTNFGENTIVDAENNWWGDASGPYSGPLNTTPNPTGTGNQVDSQTDFTPWLTARCPDAPPY